MSRTAKLCVDLSASKTGVSATGDQEPERSSSPIYRYGVAINYLNNKHRLMICGSSILRDADKHTMPLKIIWTTYARPRSLRTQGCACKWYGDQRMFTW